VGFVEFASQENALKALNEMDNKKFMGVALRVKGAPEKKKKPQ